MIRINKIISKSGEVLSEAEKQIKPKKVKDKITEEKNNIK